MDIIKLNFIFQSLLGICFFHLLLQCLNSWSGIITLSNHDQARDDNGNESDNFGVREEVLNPCAPFHIGTVDKSQ